MIELTGKFPLRAIHSGVMTGGTGFGVTCWGTGRTLNLSIGLGDLWDHRGGMPWTPTQNFKATRAELEKMDYDGIRRLYAMTASGSVQRPTMVPFGRIVLTLPQGEMLKSFRLVLQTGSLFVSTSSGKTMELCCSCDNSRTLAMNDLPAGTQIDLCPSYRLVKGAEALAKRGWLPPEEYKSRAVSAFYQALPNDPGYSLTLKRKGSAFTACYWRGDEAIDTLTTTELPGFAAIRSASHACWKKYWRDVPVLEFPDDKLTKLYWRGMYQYGIMSDPAGAPPALQGPWIEDHQLPPWEGDYHFNINVQMCLAPGFAAGKFQNLKKCFDLVLSWKEQLRYNARCFVGIDNGYMLPHAVDDRGTCMGGFWTGCIDHASSAWMAMLMYDYCDYSGDFTYLKDEVYDFMLGVLRVFEAMMERRADGMLHLPVSISPEYRGSLITAWGVNSSFQLAAIHRLARNLIAAAEQLRVTPDPFAVEIEEKLPPCSLFGKGDNAEIGLWDDLTLEESHRHHSHLGGICPFDTIDPDDPEWSRIIANSLNRWTILGMGLWSGWCISWASRLRIRFNDPETAYFLLQLWQRVYSNEAGTSFHDAQIKGFAWSDHDKEIMQMDGTMGMVNAVQELFAYRQNGVLNFFRGIPREWGKVRCQGIFLPGGIKADGSFINSKTRFLTLTSARDAKVAIRVPDAKEIFRTVLKAGETLTLTVRKGTLVRL